MHRSQRFSLRGFFYLLLTVAILLYALMVLGGVVRAIGAGAACPDWPTCFGEWRIPARGSAALDGLHRLVTLLVFPLAGGVAFAGWRWFRRERWISRPLSLAAGLMVAQIALGGVMVLQGAPPGLSVVHLILSLLVLGLVLVALVVAFDRRQNPSALRFPTFRSPYARLSLGIVGVMFVLMASGAIVAGSGATSACPGWPLCGGAVLPTSAAGWINLFHRLIVGLTGAALVALLFRAWRTQRSQTVVLVSATAAAVLFFAQSLLGALEVGSGFPVYLLGLHKATAIAVWGTLVIHAAVVGVVSSAAEPERVDAPVARTRLMRDFLVLTKPIVVVLLLVTTYAGMVIGAKAWPSVSLTFWVLLGGAMAAGGSGAINQYIDRYDDIKMQRTSKRPIPAGRLTPGEGLAFGVALCLASFYLLVAFVNFLAACLSLAGMIYYVLIYSILLKKTTALNIVIGGGAGAIPPLVGWAAATGSLNIPALFLFAVVFMWTPPHFWALALVRRKDYARAGVPMLPVVRGEKETRWQILIYTIELVALTLLLPLFGLGGGIYLVAAVVLGGALFLSAWKVWRQGGNKVAWKMYRHSSMYLAFLFMALMVDALV